MSAARMKDQADFDLERFIDMFDQALTSNDERVINALRSLMMMVILTHPEDGVKGGNKIETGPLRRILEDQNTINRRLNAMSEDIRRMQQYPREEDIKRQYYEKNFNQWPSSQYPAWNIKFGDDVDTIAAIKRFNDLTTTTTKGNKNGK
jgi:hypothetical protein